MSDKYILKHYGDDVDKTLRYIKYSEENKTMSVPMSSNEEPKLNDHRFNNNGARMLVERYDGSNWVKAQEFGSVITDQFRLQQMNDEKYLNIDATFPDGEYHNVWARASSNNGARYGSMTSKTFFNSDGGLYSAFPTGDENIRVIAPFNMEINPDGSIDPYWWAPAPYTYATHVFIDKNVIMTHVYHYCVQPTKARLVIMDDFEERVIYQSMSNSDYRDFGGRLLKDVDTGATTGKIKIKLIHPINLVKGEFYVFKMSVSEGAFALNTSDEVCMEVVEVGADIREVATSGKYGGKDETTHIKNNAQLENLISSGWADVNRVHLHGELSSNTNITVPSHVKGIIGSDCTLAFIGSNRSLNFTSGMDGTTSIAGVNVVNGSMADICNISNCSVLNPPESGGFMNCKNIDSSIVRFDKSDSIIHTNPIFMFKDCTDITNSAVEFHGNADSVMGFYGCANITNAGISLNNTNLLGATRAFGSCKNISNSNIELTKDGFVDCIGILNTTWGLFGGSKYTNCIIQDNLSSTVLYGTGSPPDATNLENGTLFVKYI